MGASRESYKISTRWKWGGKTFGQKVKAVYKLFKTVVFYSWEREMFIKDNITQPFDKHIGCKIFGHNFRKDYDPVEYICMKCWKRISEQEYDSMTRRKKIQKIKKKI